MHARHILHVPFTFFPDPCGGTEIYVKDLAHALAADDDWESVIAAPGTRAEQYEYEGLRVRRFAMDAHPPDLRALYGEGDAVAAENFGALLDELKPEIVHLHAYTPAVSLRLVRVAQTRNIRVILTYHTPTVSCERGTLLHWGREQCDGVLDPNLCAPCTLQGLGMPRRVAEIVGRQQLAPSRMLAERTGGIWTALRMRELIEGHSAARRAFLNESDRIISLCDWTTALLVRNGIPPEKITLIRHGLAEFPSQTPIQPRADGIVRLVSFGRIHPTKGFDVLLKAARGIPDARFELDVFGVSPDDTGAYARQLRALAKEDVRIRLFSSLAHDAMMKQLSTYDALVVPSQVIETGPLVVLEAFAAGVPVIGSNWGGIAELVTPEVDGLLVSPRDLKAWCAALERFVTDTPLRQRLRAGVRPPRSMRETAAAVRTLYEMSGSIVTTTVGARL